MSAEEHTQSKHEEGAEEERSETWRFIVPVDSSTGPIYVIASMT